MSGVINVRVDGIKRQISTLKDFIKEPRGVFETADKVIRNFRYTNKETLRELKIPKVLGRGRRF